jgi:hypothetical protein
VIVVVARGIAVIVAVAVALAALRVIRDGSVQLVPIRDVLRVMLRLDVAFVFDLLDTLVQCVKEVLGGPAPVGDGQLGAVDAVGANWLVFN